MGHREVTGHSYLESQSTQKWNLDHPNKSILFGECPWDNKELIWTQNKIGSKQNKNSKWVGELWVKNNDILSNG